MKPRSSALATRRILRFFLAAALMSVLIPVRAQTNVEVTNQLDVRTTPSATTKIELRSDGMLVGKGTFTYGSTMPAADLIYGPTFIWFPAGNAVFAGTAWPGMAVGPNSASFAGGYAMGGNAFAAASGTAADVCSFAAGLDSFAAAHSFAAGLNSTALYHSSVALGGGTAIGNWASAISLTTASAMHSLTAGRYNIGGGNQVAWIPTDPLFEIGNGSASNQRSNAFTVYKNGNATVSGTLTVGALNNLGPINSSGGISSVGYSAISGTTQNTLRFNSAGSGAGVWLGRSFWNNDSNDLFVYNATNGKTPLIISDNGSLTNNPYDMNSESTKFSFSYVLNSTTSNTSAGSMASVFDPLVDQTYYCADGMNIALTKVGAANVSSYVGLRATSSTVANWGTGTITQAAGSYSAIYQGGSSGVIIHAYSAFADSPKIVGTEGTIANAYGFYAASQKPSASSTGYGFYSEGVTDMNFFAGRVGIGNKAPAARLEVASTSGTDALTVRTQTDAVPLTPFRITADGKVLVRQQGDIAMGTFTAGVAP